MQTVPGRVTETERLVLRKFTVNDAQAMEAVFCDPEVMYSSDDGVESPEWVCNWINELIEKHYPSWGCGKWAIIEKETNEVVGYCGLSKHPDRCGPNEAELGYRLIKKKWGNGIASEAVGSVCEYGLKTLRLSRIIATVEPGNLASVRVLQKVGMRYESEIMYDGYTHPDHLYVTP